jgi:HK97 gp10 family phage protein
MAVIKMDTTVLDKIRKDLPEKTQMVGRKMAFRLEGFAKGYAAVDTGAMRNSIYTVTQISDGYSSAVSSAMRGGFSKSGRLSRGKTKKGTRNSSVVSREFEPHPTPVGNVIANVGPCVNYAEYQEFGTSKMAAHPFVTPAVERVDAEFNDPKNWEAILA